MLRFARNKLTASVAAALAISAIVATSALAISPTTTFPMTVSAGGLPSTFFAIG